MQESYAAAGEGITKSSATVTFSAPDPMAGPTSSVTVAATLPKVTISAPATAITAKVIPTSSPVPKKTTYAALPGWIALLGFGMAGLLAIVRRNS
jgi:hypothetical protein